MVRSDCRVRFGSVICILLFGFRSIQSVPRLGFQIMALRSLTGHTSALEQSRALRPTSPRHSTAVQFTSRHRTPGHDTTGRHSASIQFRTAHPTARHHTPQQTSAPGHATSAQFKAELGSQPTSCHISAVRPSASAYTTSRHVLTVHSADSGQRTSLRSAPVHCSTCINSITMYRPCPIPRSAPYPCVPPYSMTLARSCMDTAPPATRRRNRNCTFST